MIRSSLALLLLILPFALTAQDEESGGKSSPVTLESLAAGVDFVGLLQVKVRDYEEVRDVPNKGTAFMRPLVTYRHPGELRQLPREIQVYEEGVGKDKCYYPERQNEGHRFLVFLDKRKDGEGFVGSRPGCMLPVYVTERNRYALRYPIDGLEIRDRSLIREINYADPDAFVDGGDELSYQRSRELTEQGLIRRTDTGRYIYTHGIYLSDISELLRGNGESPSGDQAN